MKLTIEEDGDVEILATRKEIEMAVFYLADILMGVVPNEAIFRQDDPPILVTVSITEATG
jgi:hypothetical protein